LAGYDAQRAQISRTNSSIASSASGVESAAFARMSPLSYGSYSSSPIAVDDINLPEEQPVVQYNEVGPDYHDHGNPLSLRAQFSERTTKRPLWWPSNENGARYWRGRNQSVSAFRLRAMDAGDRCSKRF
jgi:hypothetical protein